MKRFAGLSVLALTIAATSGCGWLWGQDGYFRNRSNDYLEARQTAPMNIPQDVQAKRLDPLLPVPENVPSMNVSRNDYEVPRPQVLDIRDQSSDFTLQESSDQRWVLAQRIPTQALPAVRQFFESSGFRIAEDRPQTGEFITDWQSVDQLAGDLPSRLTARGEDLAGQELRVRARVEPGVQRNTSEIYLASAARPQGSTQDIAFAAGASKPSVEAVLLDDLLAALSSTEQGGSVSLLTENSYDAPARVTLGQDGNGNPLLTLDTDFDRAWSSVGRALQSGDVRVDDLNRSLGLYYVNLAEGAENPNERPGFFARLFGSKPSQEEIDARAERYQVRLTSVGSSIQVSVENGIDTVAPTEVSQRILTLIQDNLS